MKVGFQLPYFDWPGTPETTAQILEKVVKAVEKAGFSSFWAMDHLFQMGGAFGSKEAPLLEAYSTLSYVTAHTQAIKLGILVTNNVLRHPGILIKTVTTLDVLSGGRMYLGIGPGGMVEREIVGYGVSRPSLSERISRLEETLQIAHHMWSDDKTPFRGKFHQLEEPICSPQPISKPHPPILIGMWKGGTRMLRLSAKYADAVNLQFGSPLPEFQDWMHDKYDARRKFIPETLGRLKSLCKECGRDYEGIEKTALGTVKIAPEAMTVDDVLDICLELHELGVEHIIFNMPNCHEITPIETFGKEVIPIVSKL